MKNKIEIRPVLNCIRELGDSLLKDFKRNPIPRTMDEFMSLFKAIEERCLTAVTSRLLADYPNIPFAEGELDFSEQKAPISNEDFWVFDSMDGVIQYLQHVPGWTINIALIRGGKPYLSVIYDPLHKEMFWAQEGAGSFLNDARIVMPGKKDSRLLVGTFSHPPLSNRVPGLHKKISASLQMLLDQCAVVRSYGPTGLQIAQVSCGRIDVYYQKGLDTYNWIAGILIAQEAGAVILTAEGNKWTWGSDSLLVHARDTALELVDASKRLSVG